MPQGYSICQNCKRPNYNVDHCSHCGTFISIEPIIIEENSPVEEPIVENKRNITLLEKLQKQKAHPNPFIRVLAQIAYSITVVVISIAAFIGSLIVALAG